MNLGKTVRVFIDTEFTDFINMDLISIGAKAETGEEFYGENSEFIKPWASDFVQQNIYPLLNLEKYGLRRLELSARLWAWIEELPCEFVIITFDYKSDWELMHTLFQEDKHPKIIAAENLFNNIYYSCDTIIKDIGGSNDAYDNLVTKVKAKFQLGVIDYFLRTKEVAHHALSDAKANCEAYNIIVNEFGVRK